MSSDVAKVLVLADTSKCKYLVLEVSVKGGISTALYKNQVVSFNKTFTLVYTKLMP